MSNSALLAALALAAATPDRLPPIDQCSGDPSFERFRSELAAVVVRQDKARLLELVDDHVQVDLGGDGFGKPEFIAAWKLDQPQTSKLWGEIATLMRLGCTTGGGGHLMPSLFEQAGDVDTLETYVAVVPGSPLRSEPRADAPAVATLHWDVLKLEEVMDDPDWWRVRLSDGRRGYVRQDEARNPIDYRMLIARIDGGWRIRALVAGD